MKAQLNILALVIVFLSVAHAATLPQPETEPEQEPVAPNLEAIQQELETTRQEVRRLEHQLTAALERLDRTDHYLRTQAKNAERMIEAVGQAEEQGFVPGINWQSRETLIGAWRDFYGEMKNGLPPAQGEEGEKPKGRVR